jgi:putative methionine-R-sulfoxide reductase with GAF domain
MDSESSKFSTWIEFFSIKPHTVSGKMKLLLLLFIFILSGFSFYIYLKVDTIKRQYFMMEKYNFAFQNVFVLEQGMTKIQAVALEKYIKKDTSLAYQSIKDLIKVTDTVTYALSLADTINYHFQDLKPVLNAYEAVIQDIGRQMNHDLKQGVQDAQRDSVLTKRIKENEVMGGYYGTLFGSFFPKLLGQKDSTNESLLRQTKELPIVIVSLSMIMSIVIVIIGRFILLSLRKSISKPKEMIEMLAKGEIPEQLSDNKDELSYIIAASNQLAVNLKAASDYALEIGQSNFQYEFTPIGNKDKLGNALVKMSEDLKSFHLKEKQHNWAITGQAKFAEIIRLHNTNLKETCSLIISELIKYLHLNQGAIFVLNTDLQVLEMKACYAYDRNKYLDKAIEIGEGMAGQCFQEKATIYMNDLPEEYMFIKSGLGYANPKAILIVPMVYNESTEGVIELATFNDFEKYQIEFVEKLATMLGGAIAAVKQTELTNKLFRESQSKTQNLSQQEEELRQNLEELHATQEEMIMREKAYQKEIELLKSRLDKQLKA